LRNAVELPEEAHALFDALRAERSRFAKQQGVPPYVIFHDSTLRAMALGRPRNLNDMAELPGMGSSKLERYGAAFLGVIRATL
jgi:ATP-dependent DNA helicase RecQ